MHQQLLPAIITCTLYCSNAFQSTILPFARTTKSIVNPRKTSFVILSLAKSKSSSKGFQKQSKKSNKKKIQQPQQQQQVEVEQREESTLEKAAKQQLSYQNEGVKALERLRDEQRSKEEDDIRKIREIKSVDEFIREDPNAAVIPEKVAMRMGNRMLPFVGIPLFGVMGTFVGFWYMATVKGVMFETNIVAYSTIFVLVIGLMGITYSVMSASWDPDVKGSTLGIDEFKSNVDSIKGGLKRSRETLIIREKMAGRSEEEVQNAIRALDKKELKDEKKKLSSMDKLKQELE